MTLEMLHKSEDNHYESLVKELEGSTKNMDQIVKEYLEFHKLFGPYGKHKKDIIDASFNTIIENIVPEIFRIAMININKEIPSSQKEVEKYLKMAKFEKHEKYPDELNRQFIDQIWKINVTDAQFRHYLINRKPAYLKVVNKLRESVKMLLNSRTLLHKALIDFDAYLQYFNPYQATKEQMMSSIKAFRSLTKRIPSSLLWGIHKSQEKIISKIDIHDKEAETLVFKETGQELPKENTYEYDLTVYKI